jgi:hypothetical protein
MMVLLIFTILIVGIFICFALYDYKTELKYMNTLKEKELEQFKKK